MDILENINEIGNKLSNNLNLETLQDKFLNTTIGRLANTAIDIGLKSLLPDFIENEIIEVKDALINGGVKEGVNTAIENAIEIGKKALGIENTNFKSIEDVEKTLEEGRLINGISEGLDFVFNKLENKEIISKNVSEILKDGKNLILNNIDFNVNNELKNEIKSLEKIEEYINNWKKYYDSRNIEGLNKEYKKIEKQIKNIIPLENVINNVNKIKSINELINNSNNFDFDKVYLNLAENLK